jgi:probable O-glycosylation ligase (exosortase A-associated)
MRGVLVLLIVGAGLLAMVPSRFAGLLLYTWFTFFRPQEWAYQSIVQYRASLVIGIALLVSCALRRILPNLTHPLSIGSLLFLVWTVLTAPWAHDVDTTWRAIGDVAPAIVVALLAVTLTTTRANLTLLVATAAGSLAVHGAWQGMNQLIAGGYIAQGIGGTFNDNNAFGLALVRIAFFLIAVAQNAPWRPMAVAAGASVPLTVLAIVFTFSRGAFLSLAAGSLVFAVLQRRRAVSIVAGVALAAAIFAMLPAAYLDRVRTITSYEDVDDRSALGRLHFWQVAVSMVEDRSIGVGLGNFEAAYDDYDSSDGEFGRRRAVHNTHLQALAETGWVGFALFESLLLGTLYGAARIRWRARHVMSDPADQRFFRTYSEAILASTIAFIVGGSFLSQVLSELTWFSFAWTASLYRLQMESLAARPVAASHMVPARADRRRTARTPRPATAGPLRHHRPSASTNSR